jgi:transcriptional regulator with XRE-family HTH domain
VASLSDLLSDELKERRSRNPNLSLRGFARWLGVSPAHLSQLISGKRPATADMTKRIAVRLGLSPDERNTLVADSLPALAGDHGTAGPGARKNQLSEDRFRIVADWYHFGILSLTKIPGAKPDPRWLARRLGISATEARDALDRLVRLGLVRIKPDFRQIGESIEVTAGQPSDAMRRFHKQCLALATERIDTVPLPLRQYQTLTLSVNPARLPAAQKVIGEFLDKMERLLESGTPQEVYGVAVQLFPLSQNSKSGEK